MSGYQRLENYNELIQGKHLDIYWNFEENIKQEYILLIEGSTFLK